MDIILPLSSRDRWISLGFDGTGEEGDPSTGWVVAVIDRYVRLVSN
jgi:hypothetical protein